MRAGCFRRFSIAGGIRFYASTWGSRHARWAKRSLSGLDAGPQSRELIGKGFAGKQSRLRCTLLMQWESGYCQVPILPGTGHISLLTQNAHPRSSSSRQKYFCSSCNQISAVRVVFAITFPPKSMEKDTFPNSAPKSIHPGMEHHTNIPQQHIMGTLLT